ncbi:MAG: rubredoxin [Nanoarchaeota archaeon]|nr:rubredoxin [Nanoarchaeota archaeon]
MAKWQCTVCGYIYDGETPPATCPKCGMPGSKFIKLDVKDRLIY